MRESRPGVDGFLTGRWVDGPCWFWCGFQRTQVVWVGDVSSPAGGNAPQYACRRCVLRLHDMVWDYRDAVQDVPPHRDGRRTPLYPAHGAPAPGLAPSVRQPRTRFGRRLRAGAESVPVPGPGIVFAQTFLAVLTVAGLLAVLGYAALVPSDR